VAYALARPHVITAAGFVDVKSGGLTLNYPRLSAFVAATAVIAWCWRATLPATRAESTRLAPAMVGS
jgi:hypothetical protein